MKTLKISVLALLLTSFAFAQEKKAANVDVEETETVKTSVVEKDGQLVKQKVKTQVKKETPITFEKKTGKLNREKNPTKVTKTVSIDNDWDPFYDSTNTVTYYTYNDSSYNFEQDNKGFFLNTMIEDEDADVRSGRAIRINNSNEYIVRTDKYSGVGYFNEKGNFVVQYYDVTNDDIIEIEYVTTIK
jgi:hypothetical protein